MLKQNYYVSYCVLKTNETREFRTYKSTPVIALNDFHRSMQRTKEVDAKRKVIRPRLLANEYKIHRLYLKYPKTATDLLDSDLVQSDFDLPNTPNPVLKLRTKRPKGEKVVKQKDTQFAFMADEQ